MIAGILIAVFSIATPRWGPPVPLKPPEPQAFDSLNMRFVGHWPFGRPQTLTFDTDTRLLLIGMGGGVWILHLDNPMNPSLLSTIATRGQIHQLLFDANRQILWIAEGPVGMEGWDLQDPSNPTRIVRLTDLGNVRDIEPYQDTLLLVATLQGLQILDVHLPSSPTSAALYLTPDPPQTVACFDTLGFVGVGDSVYILNLSNPASPDRINAFEVDPGPYGPGSAYRLAAQDTFLYLSTLVDFRIYEISSSAPPTLIGYFGIDSTPILDFGVKNNIAYLALGAQGLGILDLQDPTAPALLSQFEETSSCHFLTLGDSMAIYTDPFAGVVFVNIANPEAPSPMSTLAVPDWAEDLRAVPPYVYLADGSWGFQTLVFSDPNHPQPTGHDPEIGYASAVYFNLCCELDIADARDQQFKTYGFDNPGAPPVLGILPLSGSPVDIEGSGPFRYLAVQNGPTGSLEILVVDDPSQPRWSATLPLPSPAEAVDALGNYVFTTTWDGLAVADVSIPTSPILLSTLPLPTKSYGIQIFSPYVFVGTQSGIEIIEISDPEQPDLIDSIPLGFRVQDFHVAGSWLFAATAAGVQVYDIQDPVHPVLEGYYPTPSPAEAIQFVEGKIYVACGSTGLQVYEFLPLNTQETVFVPTHPPIHLWVREKQLVVETREPGTLTLYDITGRLTCTIPLRTGRARVSVPGQGLFLWTFRSMNHLEVNGKVLLLR